MTDADDCTVGEQPDRMRIDRQPVRVRTPCRLHFGMFGFGQPVGPKYGGVGLMIEPTAVEATISAADRFVVVGDHAERARRVAKIVCDRWQLRGLPPCQIEIAAPPDHVGLGVGTQLALAVAAGLRRFVKLPPQTAAELSTATGRGRRSAVGTYGFELGGLIVDAGKLPGEAIGRLAERVAMPDGWRIVLLRHADARGLAGEREAAAFSHLPAVPTSVTERLWRITYDQMLPAAKSADCRAFGEAVYEFGRLSGSCFAAAQGGPFASRAIEELVDAIRAADVAGVGQSSWGPTVFAVVPDDDEAQRLVQTLRKRRAVGNLEIAVARPNNVGAVFSE